MNEPAHRRSPEPWKNAEDGARLSVGVSYGREITDASGYPLAAALDDEIRQRIVACVNACRGMETAELEKIAAWRETLREPVAADAANLLIEMGWRVLEPDGSEWT